MVELAAETLLRPDRAYVAELLLRFWHVLDQLPDRLARDEHLLAQATTAHLRDVALDMMLAANGIKRPPASHSLNRYLGESQRAAIEKTLIAPRPDRAAWIGQAVALVVIYRWYAPQLMEKWQVEYPVALEQSVLTRLAEATPEWPQAIVTP
jgi:hypothetical protein